MIRISNIKMNPGSTPADLKNRIEGKLGLRPDEVVSFEIIRSSVDARDRSRISVVYTVDLELASPKKEAKLLSRKLNWKLAEAPDPALRQYHPAEPGTEPLQHRPVVVGFGPCGIFAALVLAEAGYRPIVLERGKAMEGRLQDVEAFWNGGDLDPESNVQFGEGGAGTFSDGKLTTGTHDQRIYKVLQELALAGGGDDILHKQRPHIGTDRLREVVVNLRKKILELGGEVRFETKLTGWEEAAGLPDSAAVSAGASQFAAPASAELSRKLSALKLETAGGTEILPADAAILALGHSARDTFRVMAEQKLPMVQKPFSIGVRAEHLQSDIDRAQYGCLASDIGLEPADYKLSYKASNGRGVYTFCMCPGGLVVAAASQTGGVVTNGMSNANRGERNANSAVLVDVHPEDFRSEDPLAGIAFQETYERLAFEAGGRTYKAPAQRLGDFLGGAKEEGAASAPGGAASESAAAPQPTYSRGVVYTDITRCLPPFAVKAMKEAFPNFGRKIKGFDRPDTVLTAVESRSSSPVRVLRNEQGISAVDGIYPSGEGAGFAGGIVSAAVDGIRQAEQIIRRYAKPLE
ncbi:MAG: hypothetical protein E7223_07800 [Clostridiales bacterium]|nr:hypothetical protein [Clostridiales bacterium]